MADGGRNGRWWPEWPMVAGMADGGRNGRNAVI